ncbi:MAG: hypothetical protein ACLR6I_07545 [Waltera sp.]
MKPAGKFIIFIPLWERMPRSLPTCRLTALQPEDAIYPLAFQENRILVCREKQYPLGHPFFEDDRLYFCVIPCCRKNWHRYR